MKTLIYVPIEPLQERYTEQWYRNFTTEFKNSGYDVVVVDGEPLEDHVKVGTFLDINSTTHYKWSQLQKISLMFHQNLIKDGTIIFFGDIEFWGIEAVRLLAQMNSLSIKLAGFLHAASYTLEDAFAVAEPYQRYTEVGWIAALDAVFVGSHYHKNAVIDRRLKPLGAEHLGDRILVSGNPVFLSEYPIIPVDKQKICLLSNRFDAEKRPNQTLRLFAEAKNMFPDWKFVVCTGRKELRSNDTSVVSYAKELQAAGVIDIHVGLTKLEYHRLLAKSSIMVSHSIEENFGYCIVESMVYGCVPLLRKGLSHDELVSSNPDLLFEGTEDLTKLTQLISNQDLLDSVRYSLQSYVRPYLNSMESITKTLGEL